MREPDHHIEKTVKKVECDSEGGTTRCLLHIYFIFVVLWVEDITVVWLF
jgi:hypothetical protein